MVSIQTTLEINVMASIIGFPHGSRKVIALRVTLFSKAFYYTYQLKFASMKHRISDDLLDCTMVVDTTVESSPQFTLIDRPSIVVSQSDELEWFVLVDVVCRGRHLAIKGRGIACKRDGAENDRELHLGWIESSRVLYK
jgi:hypothetical protein